MYVGTSTKQIQNNSIQERTKRMKVKNIHNPYTYPLRVEWPIPVQRQEKKQELKDKRENLYSDVNKTTTK